MEDPEVLRREIYRLQNELKRVKRASSNGGGAVATGTVEITDETVAQMKENIVKKVKSQVRGSKTCEAWPPRVCVSPARVRWPYACILMSRGLSAARRVQDQQVLRHLARAFGPNQPGDHERASGAGQGHFPG